MVKVSRSIVPSFFTVGNMFCGFYSIIAAIQGDYNLAAWMIVAGAFLDAMDGKIARLTQSSSQFGIEYDSLADVITFGLAPSLLIYIIFGKTMGFVGIFISFLPLLFGSIRLARFNSRLKGFDKDYFSGLPIPVAAITITGFILFSNHFYADPVKFPKTMIVMILFLSVLMVSNIRYETAPKLNFKGSKREKIKFILVIIGTIIIIIVPHQSLFPLIVLYIISGLVAWIFRLNRDQSIINEDEVEVEGED
jgi:CDP-diacylglycerol--serine O-phosphatidyltransferase